MRRNTDKARTSAIESPPCFLTKELCPLPTPCKKVIFVHPPMNPLNRPTVNDLRRRGRAGACATSACNAWDSGAQNRRAMRLGCFVPRHPNSPRLTPSSLSSSSSSPPRSFPFVLTLLFGRGGESESDDDDDVFESTLLRATEAGTS